MALTMQNHKPNRQSLVAMHSTSSLKAAKKAMPAFKLNVPMQRKHMQKNKQPKINGRNAHKPEETSTVTAAILNKNYSPPVMSSHSQQGGFLFTTTSLNTAR